MDSIGPWNLMGIFAFYRFWFHLSLKTATSVVLNGSKASTAGAIYGAASRPGKIALEISAGLSAGAGTAAGESAGKAEPLGTRSRG